MSHASCRNTQTALAINSSVPPLVSAHSAYTMAFVHSAILLAATGSKDESLAVQQLAVSVAPHDASQSLVLAQYQAFYIALISVENDLQLSADQLSGVPIWVPISMLGDGITKVSSLLSLLHAKSVANSRPGSLSKLTTSLLLREGIKHPHLPSRPCLVAPLRLLFSPLAKSERLNRGPSHHRVRNSQGMQHSCCR